jgi:hypothetical protein
VGWPALAIQGKFLLIPEACLRLPKVHSHMLSKLQPGEHEGSGRDQGFINRKRGEEGGDAQLSK